jgi:hypothetical protein
LHLERVKEIGYALDRLAKFANIEGHIKTAGNLKLAEYMLLSARYHAAGEEDLEPFRPSEVDRYTLQKGVFGFQVLDSDFQEIRPLSRRQFEALREDVRHYEEKKIQTSSEESAPDPEVLTVEFRCQAAIEYLRRDWPVIPLHTVDSEGLCSCGENPCRRYYHPRLSDWRAEATTDEAKVSQWLDRWPDMNIGIVTGQKSNLAVLEAYTTGNCGPQGHNMVAMMEDCFRPLPETLTQSTYPGKEESSMLNQYFFQYPKTCQIQGSELALGFNMRASNDYVLAAPSRFRDGNYLRWELPSGETTHLLNSQHQDPAPFPEMLVWVDLVHRLNGESEALQFEDTGEENP